MATGDHASSLALSTSSRVRESSSVHHAVVSDDEKNGVKTPSLSSQAVASSRYRKKKSPSLPIVLMDLLSDPTNSDVMTFLPDGDSFVFVNIQRFEATLMKKYFRISRFDTFERKLELWGFRRDNYVLSAAGKDGSRTFRHSCFRRGDMDACRRIRCQRRSQCFVYTAVPARPISIPSLPLSVSVNNRSSSPLSTVSTLGSRPSSPVSVRDNAKNRDDVPLEITMPSSSSQLSHCSDSSFSMLSDTAVSAATREVVGAALDVLMHDKVGLRAQSMHGVARHMTMGASHLQARWIVQQQRRRAMMAMLYKR